MPSFNPHPNPNARNLQDMLNAGGLELAVRLRNLGYRGITLIQALGRAFVNALSVSINALAGRSLVERNALAAANLARPQDVIQVPSVLTNANVSSAINISVRVPVSRNGQRQRDLFVLIELQRQESKQAIQERINSCLRNASECGMYLSPAQVNDLVQSGPFVVVKLERRG